MWQDNLNYSKRNAMEQFSLSLAISMKFLHFPGAREHFQNINTLLSSWCSPVHTNGAHHAGRHFMKIHKSTNLRKIFIHFYHSAHNTSTLTRWIVGERFSLCCCSGAADVCLNALKRFWAIHRIQFTVLLLVSPIQWQSVMYAQTWAYSLSINWTEGK